MNNRLPILLTSLAFISVVVYRPSLSAMPGGELAAAETAVRQADADRAAAARTASVDAWMAFYATDAVVVAPNAPIVSDRELIRHMVTNLLTLPGLSLAWRPTKIQVATSGDLAYLIAAYELRYDDPVGAHVAERGKLLEIWRKQSDGNWRCSVDTWTSEEHTAAPHTAAAQGAAPPSASGRPPPAVSAPNANYGEMPAQYEESIRQYFQKYLKDPDSVRYEGITQPERGVATTVTGAILPHQTHLLGWTVKATINAKNSRGAYVGPKTYTFLFRGEKIVHTVSPLAQDELQ